MSRKNNKVRLRSGKTSNDLAMARQFRRGVSLIEAIACMALIGIVIVPIAGMLQSANRMHQQSQVRKSDSHARQAVRWLRRQLAASPGVDSITANRLRFLDDSGNAIQISRTGNQMIRDDGAAQTTIVENVVRLQFTRVPADVSQPLLGIQVELETRDLATNSTINTNALIAR